MSELDAYVSDRIERVNEATLNDGDVFSYDEGCTWYVYALRCVDVIAVYSSMLRGDDSPTVRVDVPVGASVLVLR